MRSEGEETLCLIFNCIALILNKIRLKKVNRLIHEKNRDYTFFTILFDDPYPYDFESHRVCKIVKSYDFTSKLSILTTMSMRISDEGTIIYIGRIIQEIYWWIIECRSSHICY